MNAANDAADPRLPGGPQPPDNRGMENRVKALEDFASAAKDRLARIEATMATKEDVLHLEGKMHQELHSLTWRVIGWTTGISASLVGVTFFIARNVH